MFGWVVVGSVGGSVGSGGGGCARRRWVGGGGGGVVVATVVGPGAGRGALAAYRARSVARSTTPVSGTPSGRPAHGSTPHTAPSIGPAYRPSSVSPSWIRTRSMLPMRSPNRARNAASVALSHCPAAPRAAADRQLPHRGRRLVPDLRDAGIPDISSYSDATYAVQTVRLGEGDEIDVLRGYFCSVVFRRPAAS